MKYGHDNITYEGVKVLVGNKRYFGYVYLYIYTVPVYEGGAGRKNR